MAHIDYTDFHQSAPAAVAALMALGHAVGESGLEKDLVELVKLRVSQINGCAFCVQYHLNLVRKLSVSAARLDLLVAWRDVPVFSARERMALAWAEALTGMAGRPVDEALREQLATVFSTEEIVFLTAAVGGINAWNRIAGGLAFTPPSAAA